jgi:hypothetical protein
VNRPGFPDRPVMPLWVGLPTGCVLMGLGDWLRGQNRLHAPVPPIADGVESLSAIRAGTCSFGIGHGPGGQCW